MVTVIVVCAGVSENLSWKESSMPPDSSSSETGKDTPPEAIKFIVGEGSEQETSSAAAREKPSPKDRLEKVSLPPRVPSPGMVRSYSQDTNMLFGEERPGTSSSFLSKTSYSDNSLGDSSERLVSRFSSLRKHQQSPHLRDLPTVASVDDETLSTDSNSTADNDEIKRRRRKLHFPAFRKNKTKLT